MTCNADSFGSGQIRTETSDSSNFLWIPAHEASGFHRSLIAVLVSRLQTRRDMDRQIEIWDFRGNPQSQRDNRGVSAQPHKDAEKVERMQSLNQHLHQEQERRDTSTPISGYQSVEPLGSQNSLVGRVLDTARTPMTITSTMNIECNSNVV
eukprot:6464497-Amphidinium_carterae.1